jgi:hypothetical protein
VERGITRRESTQLSGRFKSNSPSHAGDAGPAIGVVAHTRKPQGDERVSGRSLLNMLAGSYVLGSVARTAFVMQVHLSECWEIWNAVPKPDHIFHSSYP